MIRIVVDITIEYNDDDKIYLVNMDSRIHGCTSWINSWSEFKKSVTDMVALYGYQRIIDHRDILRVELA